MANCSENRQPKFIYFIHVPKTAGTYVTEFLKGQLGDQFVREGHTVPAHALHPWTERFGPAHYTKVGQKDCFTLSVVRNPFDLLVSMYLFGFPYWSPRSVAGRRQIVWPFSCFRDYVTKLCAWDDYPWICPEQKGSLFFQLFDNNGTCFADVILRQERLTDGLQALGARLGKCWDLPKNRINVNNRYDYRDFYDDYLKQLVEARFAADSRIFGYDFEQHDERAVIDGKDIHLELGSRSAKGLPTQGRQSASGPRRTGPLADQDFHDWDETMLEQFRGGILFRHLLRRLSIRFLGLPD
ncbi:MAG: hypothetical protein E4H01_06165 [Lysobacterales bacterium]|nr:MAG: hypothetical protein E4H01_06165 [Xanthomonadales bacterium]